MRQRHRRSKGEDLPSPAAITHLSHDLSSVLPSRDALEHDLNDLMMSSLDMTMTCIGDGDAFGWNNNSEFPYHSIDDYRTQEGSEITPMLSREEGKETLTGQLIKLNNRVIGATRELDCAVVAMPLTVNSLVINEAFEAANSLLRIVDSITLAEGTSGSSEPSPRDGSKQQLSTGYSPISLAFATHQHILALSRAVCDSVKSSLGSIGPGTEQQQQTLHGAGSSAARFIMVLQLIMHLFNRIGRSLRIGNQKTTDQHELMLRSDRSGESGSLQRIVDSAHVMLSTLSDEHDVRVPQAPA